jgi:hypothetical protein
MYCSGAWLAACLVTARCAREWDFAFWLFLLLAVLDFTLAAIRFARVFSLKCNIR